MDYLQPALRREGQQSERHAPKVQAVSVDAAWRGMAF